MENTTKIHFHHDNAGDNLDGTDGKYMLFSMTKDKSTDSFIRDTTPSKPSSMPPTLTYLLLPQLTSMILIADTTMNHVSAPQMTFKLDWDKTRNHTR